MSFSSAPVLLEGDHEADVVVIGGGLAAYVTALALAERRCRVIVVARATAAEAGDLGHVAVGLLTPYAEACRRLGREAARELWVAMREGYDRLRDRLVELGDDCGQERRGSFRLADDRPGALALAESDELLREDGFAGEFLDHYMLEIRFDVQGFAAGYWAGDDGELDASRLAARLAATAKARGVEIYEGNPLVDLDLSGSGAEVVAARGRVRASRGVVADDSEARRFLPALEGWLTLRPVEVVTYRIPRRTILPTPAVLQGAAQRWQVVGDAARLEAVGGPESVEALAGRLGAALERLVSRASRWRADTPDGLPLIGPLPGGCALLGCGFGWTAAAWAHPAARWIAEAVATGRDVTPSLLHARRALADSAPAPGASGERRGE